MSLSLISRNFTRQQWQKNNSNDTTHTKIHGYLSVCALLFSIFTARQFLNDDCILISEGSYYCTNYFTSHKLPTMDERRRLFMTPFALNEFKVDSEFLPEECCDEVAEEITN